MLKNPLLNETYKKFSHLQDHEKTMPLKQKMLLEFALTEVAKRLTEEVEEFEFHFNDDEYITQMGVAFG